MKKKLIALASFLGLAAITLSSCGGTERNTSTPYGNLNMDEVVATALDNQYSITNKTFYNKLRYNSNTIVTNQIKKALYKKELAAITELFKANSINDLSDTTKNLIVPTKDNKKLFELTGTELLTKENQKVGCTSNYDVIKMNLMQSVNGSLSSSIFSTQDSDTIKKKTDTERNTAIKTYIVQSARKGINLTKEDLAFTYPASESNYKIITFTNLQTDKFARIIDSTLLTEAEKLSSQNALYQIADLEYVKAYDADEDDEDTKNSYYLYKDSSIETTYESSYQTFGTYHAIVIQFNSRKEAIELVNKLKNNDGIDFTNLQSLDAALDAYVKLYNEYYSYKQVTSYNDERFSFTVNEVANGFSDVSNNIKTLIQDTLEDGDYLIEPRNISDKYVMAIRFDTKYDVSGTNEETKYSELNDTLKKEYTTKIKYNTLITNSSSYISTNLKSNIYNRSNNSDTNDDIFIYDPFFENKFYSTYSTDYNLIDKSKFNNDLIFSIDDYKYSVSDLYNEASLEFSNSILTNYFELEYAYKYYSEFVDTDTHDSNVETLETAISDFEGGKNTSYDKEIGLETFLLSSYGYTTKDEIIKYYYDASSCLSNYISKKVFTDWAIKNSDNTYSYDTKLETSGILYNLLNEGNNKYSDLFNINLDHFLINIDDDGDGSPDDPDEFIKSMTEQEKDDFQNAVVELARALYTEATYQKYDGNSLYKILTFIKSQYENGEKLKSDSSKSWDDYKKYNFLITVEQLASSGDITQDTVSNFVKPFADYVKGVYKTCVDNSVSTKYENGTFYYYNTDTKEGNVMTSATDITTDTLCKTVYGYHVLILNSYSKANETEYTESEDSSGVQSKIQVLIKEDSDDSSNNIYVTMNSYNEVANKVSFNQFFIYYVQKANGVESSLSSDISSLLSSMYDDVISTYTSNNFQTFLLLNKLNITSTNTTIKGILDSEKTYYANLVCDYADSADVNNDGNIYYNWVFGNLDWTRPEK